MKKIDKRKRLRCKNCGLRSNVHYDIIKDKIRFTCPKCLCQGELKITKKI